MKTVPGTRFLIVNADDFGQTQGVNEGIMQAHEEGIVTSASLMVRWTDAQAAARYARKDARLSVGLHIDLGEWAFSNGEWVPVYDVVPLDNAGMVREEIGRQLQTFYEMVGSGPTHLDSHQHVHLDEPARTIVLQTAAELHIPVRRLSDRIRYCGDFYGQTTEGDPFPDGIGVEALVRILRQLPEGTTELACHPGLVDRSRMTSQYLDERSNEVLSLCDPVVRDVLRQEEIACITFRDVHDLFR